MIWYEQSSRTRSIEAIDSLAGVPYPSVSLSPIPCLPRQRAITFEDYIALKSVSDPQLSPDGKWVAYTVSTPSLQDNRNVARVWVVEVATGQFRQLRGRARTAARWSPTERRLAFVPRRATARAGLGSADWRRDARECRT